MIEPSGGIRAPLVSVTVTNYNYARFLPRNIESILRQEFTDFELVIIDNASTDDSVRIIEEYAASDPRVRLIAHTQNQGGLASFRESCDVSRGRYRVHVDADDWVIRPDAFQLQLAMLEEHADMAFVYSSLAMFDEHDRKSVVSRPYNHDTVLPGAAALVDILGFSFGHSGMMLRLDTYRATRGYPDGMPHIDDLVLAVRLAELGSVGYIDAELFAFRQHGANVHMSPQRSVVRDEILPMIASAFDGPLGAKVADSRATRRRIEKRALVHLPTAYIFTDRRVSGWRLYWESVQVRPLMTVMQPRTLSLIARTCLGQRGFEAVREATRRVLRSPRSTETEPVPAPSLAPSVDAVRRYAFISPCGWGNLGDAAIVDSLIHGIRTHHPEAVVTGYTLHSLDTAMRHGIGAGPLTSFSLPFYPLFDTASNSPYVLPMYDGSTDSESTSDVGRTGGLRRVAKRHRWVVSLVCLVVGVFRARHERSAMRAQASQLAGTRAVVVAGGGQLDARFGGIFGQPFVLWRWKQLARKVGADFVVLSVGTGTLTAAERRVTCLALRHADYRSYRDKTSPLLLRCPSVTEGDPIVPDLAYALPICPVTPPEDQRIVVGVSPMNYQHPDFYPAGDISRYEQHVSKMHEVCVTLLRRGHDVVLFTTDASDDVGLAAVIGRLEAEPDGLVGCWSVAGARTVAELMEMYQRLHVVVASRLHGVLLAHVAHRPVLALAHERKVRTLMHDIGHDRFCFELGEVDDNQLVERLIELIDRRQELSQEIAATATSCRARVERQYLDVFGAQSGSVS
jgi:glycosyltransferase involved in cell wall biosynthesis/polysaccharide pyruvyl transferase WcaK-like protein